jgi:2-keto-4-pentenoate hydratase
VKRIGTCQIEPEICLTIGKSLEGSNLDVDEVKDAVTEVAPSFEINELRRSMPDSPWSVSIADDLSNWGVVVGEGVAASEVDLTQTEVVLTRDNEVVSATVLGPAMDDPYKSLVELCATLHRFDLSLHPGQRVITGAFSRDAVPGTGTWAATFGGIGTVEITFD